MKSVTTAVLALSMMSALGMAGSALADGGFSENETASRYFTQMRPMVARMNAADKKKAMDMEMAIMKMESSHQMAMGKATMEHKMAIMKMRQEYEDHIYSKGGF
jgi:hypothetical protein